MHLSVVIYLEWKLLHPAQLLENGQNGPKDFSKCRISHFTQTLSTLFIPLTSELWLPASLWWKSLTACVPTEPKSQLFVFLTLVTCNCAAKKASEMEFTLESQTSLCLPCRGEASSEQATALACLSWDVAWISSRYPRKKKQIHFSTKKLFLWVICTRSGEIPPSEVRL